MIITIDGPAGTGKTTVAKKVAEILGFDYFDTGAMYRSITWQLLEKNATLSDEEEIEKNLAAFSFEIQRNGGSVRYFVNGIDVTAAIRSQKVTARVSFVSSLKKVRESLWEIQRKFAKNRNAVFEGRDMGTVVFPQAEVKIFLTARAEERAQRRLKELEEKNPEEAALFNLETMRAEIAKRDDTDSSRELAQLRCPEDAYVIDTSDLSIDQVVDQILCRARLDLPRKKHRFYFLILFLAKVLFKCLYRHRVYGLEHFFRGPGLIAANHCSFYDPPIVSISWPEEVHFLARESLFKNRIFGAFIRALNTHPVRGDALDLSVFKLIGRLLKEGKKVIVFPEGARSETGELQELKAGVAYLMVSNQASIIPAYVYGSFSIWKRSQKLPKWRGKTACVFGKPLHWKDFSHLDKKEAQKAILQVLKESLIALKRWYEEGATGVPP